MYLQTCCATAGNGLAQQRLPHAKVMQIGVRIKGFTQYILHASEEDVRREPRLWQKQVQTVLKARLS